MNPNGYKTLSYDSLRTPDSDCAVYWSWVWNGELSESEITRQLDDFKKAGISALYIIPEPKEFRPTSLRTYLSPDYLSDGYLSLYAYAFSYAEKLGMRLWLYDEGGWPSGGACGLTKKAYPNCDPILVTPSKRSVDGVYHASPDAIAAYSVTDNGYRRVRDGEAVGGSRSVEITEYRAVPTYRGVNAVDMLNPEVTRTFLHVTHEQYQKRLGNSFGKSISMVFTDEPHAADNAWRDDMPSLFERRFGYDMRDYLPEIYGDAVTEAGRKAKSDFKQLLCSVFEDGFFKPCIDWCHRNNLLFGGHLNFDHGLAGSIAGEYYSGLHLLRLFDIPGVDAIWQQIFPRTEPVNDNGYPFFPRYASSAAAQSGRELALSESFAVYGEDFSPDEMRYVIGYQLIRGINVFNFMNLPFGRKKALTVSMRPMFCPEKPGFFHYHRLTEETARACRIMRTGRRVCDTALYLPSADLAIGGRIAAAAGDSFVKCGKALEDSYIDFDIIDDEAILTADSAGDALAIGHAVYRHIVIPDCRYMPDNVRAIAERYRGQGEPLLSCNGTAVRAAAREWQGGRVYAVFNEHTERQTLTISVNDTRPFARMDLSDGHYYRSELTFPLESGETAFFIFGGDAEKNMTLLPSEIKIGTVGVQDMSEMKTDTSEIKTAASEIKTAASEIKTDSPEVQTAASEMRSDGFGLSFVSARRFILDASGVSSEKTDRLPDRNFSGEITYRLKLSVPNGRYRLRFDNKGYRFALTKNGDIQSGIFIADCAVSPQTLDFDFDGNDYFLTVANTSVDEIHAKMPIVSQTWEKAEYGYYHDKLMTYETVGHYPLPMRIYADLFRLN